MKKINIIAITLLCLLASNCSKNDNSEKEIGSLYQTFWKGKLTIPNGGEYSTYNINITFNSEDLGVYRVENLDTENKNSSNDGFSYKTYGKILEILGRYDNILYGEWWKVEEGKDKLIFKRNFNDPLTTSTLIIKKQKL